MIKGVAIILVCYAYCIPYGSSVWAIEKLDFLIILCNGVETLVIIYMSNFCRNMKKIFAWHCLVEGSMEWNQKGI